MSEYISKLGNESLVISSSGNVGIGTTDPSKKLHVDGDVRITGHTVNEGWLQAAGSNFNLGNNNYGVFLGTYSGGTSISPGEVALSTQGKTGWAIGDELGRLRFFLGDSSGVGVRDVAKIVAVNEFNGGTTASGALAFYTSPYNSQVSESVRIDSDGNVGIGATDPAHKLDVSGSSARIGGNFATATLYIQACDTSGAPATTNRIIMQGYENRAQGTFYENITYTPEEWFSGIAYNNNNNTWQVGYDVSAGCAEYTDKSILTVKNTGNVGINNSSPLYELDVSGSIRSVTTSGGTSFRGVAEAPNSDYTALRISNDTVSDSANFGFSIKYMGTRTDNLNSLSIFSDNCTGTQVEAVSIMQDGNVGIGTSDAGAPLELNPSGSSLVATSKALIISNKNDTAWTADALTAYNATTSFGITDLDSLTFFSRPTDSNILTFASETINQGTLHRFVNLNSSAVEPLYRWDFYQYDGSGTGSDNFKIPDKLFQIRVRTGASETEKFTIKGNGNVGINTNDPSELLEVAGNISASNINLADSIYFRDNSTSTNVNLELKQYTTEINKLTYNSGEGMTGGGAWKIGGGVTNYLYNWTGRPIVGVFASGSSTGGVTMDDFYKAITPGQFGAWTTVTQTGVGTAIWELSSSNEFANFANRSSYIPYVMFRTNEVATNIKVEYKRVDTSAWVTVFDDTPEYSDSYTWAGSKFNTSTASGLKGIRYTLTFDGSGTSYVKDIGLTHANFSIGGTSYGWTGKTNYWSGLNFFSSGVYISDRLYDTNDSSGSSGQILSSTGTTVDWVDASEVGIVDGSGTLNYLPKWTPDGDSLGDSIVYDDGTCVGIGTPNPGAKLHIYGSGQQTLFLGSSNANRALFVLDGASNGDGSGGDYAYLAHNADGSLELKNLVTSSINFGTGPSGDIRMTISSSGVGIGTTDPKSLLHIDTNSGIGTIDPAYSINIRGDGIDGIQILSDESFSGRIVFGDQNSNTVGQIRYDHSTDAFRFFTSGTEKVSILSDGNVGIGTDSPNHKLEVTGDAGLNDLAQFYALGGTSMITIGTGSLNDLQSGIKFKTLDVAGTADATSAIYQYGNTFGNNHLHIQSADQTIFLSGSTETVRIDESGNVGIGRTNPGTKLDVAGIISVRESSNVAFYGGNYIRLFDDPSFLIRETGGATRLNFNTTTGDLGLYNSSTVLTNHIDTDGDSFFNGGNVGIGTTSPSEKLTIEGNISASGDLYLDGGIFDTNDSTGTSGQLLSSTGTAVDWVDATSIDGFVSGSGTTNYIPIWKSSSELSSSTIYQLNGNVGIGTDNPSYKFEITSDAGSGLISRIYNTNADGQGLLIRAGSTASATRVLQLASENDTKIMTVNSNGKVGIGTTTPNSRLDVRSTSAFTNGVAYVEQGLATNLPTLLVNQTVSGGNPNVDQGLVVKAVGTSDGSGNTLHAYQRDGSTTGLVVKGSGRVGIGTTTPDAKLELSSSTADPLMRIKGIGGENILYVSSSGNVGIGTPNPDAKLHIAGSGGDVKFTIDRTDARTYSIYTESNSSLRIKDEDASADRLTILSDGNIGIGTTDPTQKLDVAGNIRLQPTSGTPYIQITDTGVVNSYIKLLDGTQVLAVGDDGTDDMFSISMDTEFVGIGTLTASANLHVEGSGSSILKVDGNNGTLFEVQDDLSDSLMSVNDAAGLPVFEVFADSTIIGGRYNQNDFYLDGTSGNVGIGTSSACEKLTIEGSISASGDLYLDGGIFDTNDSTGTSGQLLSSTGTATDWIDSTSIDGFVSGSGTAGQTALWTSANTLSSSRIYQNSSFNSIGLFATPDNQNGLFQIGDSSVNDEHNVIIYSDNEIQFEMYTDYGIGNAGISDTVWFSNPNAFGVQYNGPAGSVYPFYFDDAGDGISSTCNKLCFNVSGYFTGEMVIQGDGNVGIGTPNPDAKLELSSSTAQSLLNVNKGDLYVSGSGNVGIGTTDPDSRLHVVQNVDLKTACFKNTSGRAQVIIDSQSTTQNSYLTLSNGGTEFAFLDAKTSANLLRIVTNNTGAEIAIETNSQDEAVRIDSTGNVGIGIALPTALLELSSSTAESLLNVNKGYLYVSGSGKVGIGTTDPKQKLTVTGRSNFDSQNNYYGSWIDGDSSGDSFFAVGQWYTQGGRMEAGANNLNLYTHNTSHHLTLQKDGGNVGIGTTTPDAKLELSSSTAQSLLNVNKGDLYVSGSGNVGIGTDSPTEKLHVSGSVRVLDTHYLTNTDSCLVAQGSNLGIGASPGGDGRLHVDGGGTANNFLEVANASGVCTTSTIGKNFKGWLGIHINSSVGSPAFSCGDYFIAVYQ